MKITFRKISKQEEIKHFKNIKVNGFTVIKNLIPKTTIKKYLDLTKETYKKQKKIQKHQKSGIQLRLFTIYRVKVTNF